MSSSKSKTENKMGWTTPPPTQATTNLQNMVDSGGADYKTPIRNAYARAGQQLDRSYTNPLGAYTTADVRDKAQRAQHNDLNQSMGIDLSNAAQQNTQGQFNRQATVAGLTAPTPYLASSRQPWTAGDTAGLGLAGAGAAIKAFSKGGGGN